MWRVGHVTSWLAAKTKLLSLTSPIKLTLTVTLTLTDTITLTSQTKLTENNFWLAILSEWTVLSSAYTSKKKLTIYH